MNIKPLLSVMVLVCLSAALALIFFAFDLNSTIARVLLIAVFLVLAVSSVAILIGGRRFISNIGKLEDAQGHLRQSEAKYRSIFENALEGIYQTTPEGRLISVNPALARIVGYASPEEMMAGTNTITDYYVVPSDREDLIKIIDEKGAIENYLIEMKRRDGSLLWVSNTSRAVKDDDGNILYYEGMIEDITARKQTEELSRQAEEKFSKVFMTTPDAIIISRMCDGRIMDVNDGFEDMTGWKRDEVIGKISRDIKIWAVPEERDFVVTELQAGRDILHRESVLRCRDGLLLNTIYSVRTLHITGEDCLIFIITDITERKHMEENRLKLEQQFYQSQKMDAIGQLAGGVAHDFNNILMGINGIASMMLMERSPEHPDYEKLDRIQQQVDRGAKLTGQLLGIARGGKHEVKTLSINELIRKNTRFFIETKKEIEAHFQLAEDLYPVEADAGQLEQVFLNIFINAGHAMPNGGRLYIETANLTLQEPETTPFDMKPGEYVKISISDTGTGMDAPTLKRIFEPFFTTKSDAGGTGLGLASAYGIVKNHGGIINAYSEPGQGSTFNIYLPSSEKNLEQEEEKTPDQCSLAGSGEILIIDDEPMILEMASIFLEKMGYTVYAAENEVDAVSIYREKQDRINLVILDMILKGTNGASVMNELKKIKPDVKVVLSSGYGMQGDVRKVMEMGCLVFIQKPYNFKEMSATIQKALSA